MKDNYCAYVEKGLRLSFISRNEETHVRTTPCCYLTGKDIPDVKKFTKVESTDSIVYQPMRQFFKDYFEKNEDLHPFCSQCKKRELYGIESQRQNFNRLEKKLEKQNLDYDFLKLDVVISNTCNLACPFCNGTSSSLIEKISNNKDKKELPYHWKRSSGDKKVDSSIVSEACAELLKKYKIYSFKVVGGEPFLKENWEPIGKVLDSNYGQEINFEVTTNGTVMNKKILDSLSKTQKTHLRISVDSIGNNYNFIRWPHNWDKIQKNLFYLRDNRPNNLTYRISILVNVFNFELLPEIDEFFNTNSFDFRFDFTLKPFESPLQWFNVPMEIKHKVYSQMKSENGKKHIRADWDEANSSSLQMIKDNATFYLKQRNMSSQDVLGPLTRKWLCL